MRISDWSSDVCSSDLLAIGLRLLDRIEVFALDILDQRDFQRFRLVEIPDDGGDAVKLRALRRPPPAFSRDDLEPAAMGTDDDRLDHSALADAVGQFLQRALVEVAAGLFGMRLEIGRAHV